MFARQIFAVAALAVATAYGQLTITNPSSNAWWVTASTNTLAWTCQTSTYSSYTVVLTNSDTSILNAPLALIADVPNYDCSYTVNQQQSSLAVSDNWTLSLANIQNSSDIYASTPFQVKSAGSPYPTSSSSASASAASSSSTSSSKNGAASAHYAPAGMSMVAALLLGFVVA